MSLNWSVFDIENHEIVTAHPGDDKKWNPVTEALVWLSMGCGFNKITEENLRDVQNRVSIYQQVFGPYLGYLKTPDVYITDEDVRLHVGLSTNVTKMTFTQFGADMVKKMLAETYTTSGNRIIPAHELAFWHTLNDGEGNYYIR